MDTWGNIGKNMEGCSITLARVERLLDRMNDTEVETGNNPGHRGEYRLEHGGQQNHAHQGCLRSEK
jgi:hypothetical protein